MFNKTYNIPDELENYFEGMFLKLFLKELLIYDAFSENIITINNKFNNNNDKNIISINSIELKNIIKLNLAENKELKKAYLRAKLRTTLIKKNKIIEKSKIFEKKCKDILIMSNNL